MQSIDLLREITVNVAATCGKEKKGGDHSHGGESVAVEECPQWWKAVTGRVLAKPGRNLHICGQEFGMARLNITLPEELAAFVRTRVESGQYASESDVIRDGIEELIDRERPLPNWLRTEGAAAYDAWKANPSAVSSVQEVRARFEARWANDDKGE